MRTMPALDTPRLIIRPFTLDDLAAVHRILDVELGDADFSTEGTDILDERAEWLRWTVLGYEQLAKLNQPPYGERAVVLQSTDELIGACGFVPCLDFFEQLEQLPAFFPAAKPPARRFTSAEFGLYYAISPAFQRRGYATEAAKALVDYAFGQLRLRRIVATTTYDNAASIGVMRKLGMRIERNPYDEPPWLQVVAVLEREQQ